MLTIPNVSCGDGYTTGATLGPTPTCQKVIYLVANNSVFAQVVPQADNETLGDFANQPEILIPPQAAEFQRCQGVRFRNAIAGKVAQVVAQLIEPADILPVGGTPFTAILSPTGGVSGGGSGLTGDIVYSAAATRTGAVLCDGTTYDGTTTTFLALWNAIGLTFGGTGQAAFAVPDLRDRVPVGAGGNTARGANDAVAAANRHATRHRHTPHTHPDRGGVLDNTFPGQNIASGRNDVAHIVPAADGGSGVATDSLDGAAYLGLNAFILL